MRKISFKWFIIQVFMILVFFPEVFCQHTAKFHAEDSFLKIKGTSNLHDWEELVEKFNVDLVVNIDNKEIKGITKVIFSCKSTSIVSENSIMTSKTHNALKVEAYPEIKFNLSKVDQFQNINGTITGTISGDLNLAGVIQKISLSFKGSVSSNRLVLSGTKKMKMSDFKIDPPTAMLGSLKTGNEIELDYSLQFIIQQ